MCCNDITQVDAWKASDVYHINEVRNGNIKQNFEKYHFPCVFRYNSIICWNRSWANLCFLFIKDQLYSFPSFEAETLPIQILCCGLVSRFTPEHHLPFPNRHWQATKQIFGNNFCSLNFIIFLTSNTHKPDSPSKSRLSLKKDSSNSRKLLTLEFNCCFFVPEQELKTETWIIDNK